jgi:Asp-tRNA(Asn)/Glu-tRNA(Gln) amidotransferase A subunit family amidase
LIRSRQASPVEVIEAHLRRIEKINPSLNAIVTIAEDAIDRAREAEAALMKPGECGPLHGLPVTIKDTIDTKGLRTTYGSRLFVDHVPDRDATVVAGLRAAGAIILGKTNSPEMAIPYETDNPVFGRTNNPRDLDRTPGGSSGGEAAAIAAHLSPAGIGSDLSGSIRVPAHFCGIAGLKPTTGRVSMEGHVPQAAGPLSLGACIGPMARSAEDLELLFEVMAGSRDERPDLDQLRSMPVAFYVADGAAKVTDETAAAVRSAAEVLRRSGFNVREERPPAVSESSRLWIELFADEARQQMRKLYRGREDEAGSLVAAMLFTDRPNPSFEDKIVTAEHRAKGIVERETLREELLRWMKQTPLLIAPVGGTPAFAHGAKRIDVKGESISIFRAFSYAQAFNVFGLPVVTVPVSSSAEGLPIGVQIIGRPVEEYAILALAKIVEAEFQPREP